MQDSRINKESAIRKIKALIAKSKSNPCEAEAIACAEKAAHLMQQYSIDNDQLEDDKIGELRHEKRANKRWEYWIAKSTAIYFKCLLVKDKFLRVKRRTTTVVSEDCWIFIGRETNRITAELMSDYFCKTIKSMATNRMHEKGWNQTEKNKYEFAAAIALSDKLYKIAKESDNSKELALVEEYCEQNMETSTKQSKGVVLSGEMARLGFEDGNKIGINLQTTGAGKSAQISQVLAIGG